MRIAWFSDFSTGDFSSKSAYFSNLVLPLLIVNNEIDNYGNELLEVENFKILPFTSAINNHRKLPYDTFIYQVENNTKLEFIFKLLKQIPGVVIVHDLNCSSFDSSGFALEHPQKDSLTPRIFSDLSNFDLINPLLDSFNLEPYTSSLIRIFTNPRNHTNWLDFCAKQNIFGNKIQDQHAYIVPCLQAFTSGKQEDLRLIVDHLQEILITNEFYLKSSLAKWERYTFYRGNC
ncbi:MAG: hypothetical protein LBE20_01245 [Deltaproteobacteria bacterium]|jgi:hypothetical protein|nr:hypothetical protein [Deltaproteobacteria bacterium]